MAKFIKKLEGFFVYFFTGVSILIVILGFQRTKHSDAVATAPSPESQPSNDAQTLASQTQQASILDAVTPPTPVATAVASAPTTTVVSKKTAVLGTSQVIAAVGKTYNTPWGNVITSVKVKDGKVISVEMPTFPDSPPSQYAKPILISETIKSGSANVQSVSGATITSNAYNASLESALSIAAAKTVSSAPAASSSSTSKWTTAVTSAVKNIFTTNNTTVAAEAATAQTQAQVQTNTAITSSGVSGTFTGNAFSTPWGNAVASITLTNGKITNVTMPQVPQSPPSQYAQSYLVQQALTVGSANIQGVSQATFTSNAFRSSLESAIAKASGQSTVATNTNTTATQQTQTQQTQAQTQTQTYTPPVTQSAPIVIQQQTTTTATQAPTGVSGTFIGTAVQAPSGNVQVATTLDGKGKITSITLPQWPSSTWGPNATAQSILVAEALAAGSANIQGVTNATYTSNAFKSSLQDAIAQASSRAPITNTTTTAAATTQTITTTTTTPAATTPTTTTPVATTPAPAGVSGTFTGSAFGAPSGNLVASATLVNGKITAITFPQYPSFSYGPNQSAQPILVAQAIAANGVNIQGVTGATATSVAFISSLQSALVLAAAKGTVTPSTTVTTPATTATIPPQRWWDDD